MHPCLQEKALEKLDSSIGILYKIIEGNGADGLNTRVALLSQRVDMLIKRIDDIPSPSRLKTYAFLGGGATSFIMTCMFFAYKIWGIK
jgi:hypothetical protein